MNKKYQTPALLAVSFLLILLSTLVHSEKSVVLGAVQTIMLGAGLTGCCIAVWKFMKSSSGKR
ncbi:hypothetical protein [Paenibacillus sp. sgz500958]|uniref:hypothetical protein n=1 Tax=Paenibacillus sp. sgz500958 TaxID=3242475 RepID=UPI0036D40002